MNYGKTSLQSFRACKPFGKGRWRFALHLLSREKVSTSFCTCRTAKSSPENYLSLLFSAPTDTLAEHIVAHLGNSALERFHAQASRSYGLAFTDVIQKWAPGDARHKQLAKLLTNSSLLACLSTSTGKSMMPRPSLNLHLPDKIAL